jgi:hypothetical protein
VCARLADVPGCISTGSRDEALDTSIAACTTDSLDDPCQIDPGIDFFRCLDDVSNLIAAKFRLPLPLTKQCSSSETTKTLGAEHLIYCQETATSHHPTLTMVLHASANACQAGGPGDTGPVLLVVTSPSRRQATRNGCVAKQATGDCYWSTFCRKAVV